MSEPTRTPAPPAVGDVVPGEPPVPITVWHVSDARPGETVSVALAARLVLNFTHGGGLVLDLTDGEQVQRATTAARRRYERRRPADLASGEGRAALIVSGWPLDNTTGGPYLADCAARLLVGGCVAGGGNT